MSGGSLKTPKGPLRFDKPLYTATEAASYVGVPRSTFETWVRDYPLCQADVRHLL